MPERNRPVYEFRLSPQRRPLLRIDLDVDVGEHRDVGFDPVDYLPPVEDSQRVRIAATAP